MIEIHAIDPYIGIQEALGKIGGDAEGMTLHVSAAFRYEAYLRMKLMPAGYKLTPEQLAMVARREACGCDMTLGGVPARFLAEMRGCQAEVMCDGGVVAVIHLPPPALYAELENHTTP